MLFMGEEWAAAQPFPFFCDFEAELGEAVRKGRREEFAKFPEFHDAAARERIPDPIAENTFRSAKLGWDDLSREPHADWLDWYRRILAIRRKEIVPRLAQAPGHAGEYETFGDGAFRVGWTLGDGSRLIVFANLSEADLNGIGLSAGPVVWSEGQVDRDEGSTRPMVARVVDRERRGRPGSWPAMSVFDLFAERMGIEPEFRDAAGEIRRTDAKVGRRLLSAMGLAVEDAREAQTTLRELERREECRPLPPVMVVHDAGSPLAVPLTLPAGTGAIRWSIREEEGATREGEAVLLRTRAAALERARRSSRRALPPRRRGASGDRLPLASDRGRRVRADRDGADRRPRTLPCP